MALWGTNGFQVPIVPTPDVWHVIEGHWISNPSWPSSGGSLEFWLDGAPLVPPFALLPDGGTATFLQAGMPSAGGLAVHGPDAFIYISEVRFGTTGRGSTDLVTDNFDSGGYGAWTQNEDWGFPAQLSIIDDPFGTGKGKVLKAGRTQNFVGGGLVSKTVSAQTEVYAYAEVRFGAALISTVDSDTGGGFVDPFLVGGTDPPASGLVQRLGIFILSVPPVLEPDFAVHLKIRR